MSTSDSTPVPWHTPRPIDGHPGYTWHYQDEGSDLRVVMRLEDDPVPRMAVGSSTHEVSLASGEVLAVMRLEEGESVPRSTVVGSARVTRTDEGEVFTAYDAEGTKLGSGPSREALALVASVDEERQASPRCEAHARKGTGTGVCDRPLTRGVCDRASDHLDPTATVY